jgi:hypothetical protein
MHGAPISAAAPTDCRFATFEQRLSAIRGNAGLCDHNRQYVPPDGSRSATRVGNVNKKPPTFAPAAEVSLILRPKSIAIATISFPSF